MEKLVLYVYTLNKDFVLAIENDSQAEFDNYIELLSIFLKKQDNKFILGTPIQMNSDFREKYHNYVKKYKIKSPILNKFKKTLELIEENEFFWIDFKDSHTTEEILLIGNLVEVYNHSDDDKERGKLFEKRYKAENESFGILLEKYEVSVFDTSNKITIGESDRKKRVCRFCNRSMENGIFFKLKAHAISEALGNKLLVLNEECDDCNAEFGSGIEPDFIQYLNVYRVFFKVKGKNGVPKVKYKEGGLIKNVSKEEIHENNLINNDNLMVVVSRNIKFNEDTGNLSVLLESQEKLKEVNIYKTLCKYVLSVINKEELPFLKQTINWISSDDTIVFNKLPNVAMTIINEMFVENPMLSVYIRKDNTQFPHVVAEFKFKSLIFVFILPFSTKDDVDYEGKEVFDLLWEVFKHYNSVKTWSFYDFSSVEKKKYQFNMNAIQNKVD